MVDYDLLLSQFLGEVEELIEVFGEDSGLIRIKSELEELFDDLA